MVSDKTLILRALKDQFDIEKAARDAYKGQLDLINDKKIKIAIAKIKDEEIDHMQDIQKMMDIVSKYENKIKTNTSKIKNNLIKNELKTNCSLLFKDKVEDYFNKLSNEIVLLSKNEKVIYISYNKLSNQAKKKLKEKKANMKNMKFIDCISSNKNNTIHPGDLSDISINISNYSKKSKPIIIFDLINSMEVFHSLIKIIKFISFINEKASKGQFSIVWVGVTNDASKLITKVQTICDSTIN